MPMKFELWGSLEPPREPQEIGDGGYLDNWKYWTSWEAVGGTDAWKEDWIHLGDFELDLPSGARFPDEITAEDKAFVEAGLNYDVIAESSGIPVQYIRLVFKEFSDGRTQMQIREIEFYGAY